MLLPAFLFAAGCPPATTQLVRNDAPATTADELALRSYADKLDAHLLEADLVVHDDTLQAYLDPMVKRMLAALGVTSTSVRVRIYRNPFLNTVVLPNGTVYVHTGLLARVENEAQLAGVLAHELRHYVDRHALRRVRSRERREEAMSLGALLIAITGVSPQVLLQSGEDIIDVGIRGYSRDLERDADRAAITTLAASGYDAGQMARLFELLASEEEETVKDPFPYADHPSTIDRLKDCKAQLANLPAGGRIGREEYEHAVADVLLVNAAEDVKIHRFDHARRAVDRHLAIRPDSARGYFQLGEVLRSAKPANLDGAMTAYLRATELDPSFANAQKELGLLYRDRGRDVESRRRLKSYLDLAPKAPDRGIIESFLRN